MKTRIHFILFCASLQTLYAFSQPLNISTFRVVGSESQKGGCRRGEKIDYSYNETASEENKYSPSAPGCPKSTDGFRWVYFEDQPSCWLTWHQGPCKWGYVLVAQDNSNYGTCACKCSLNEKARENKSRYVECKDDAENLGHVQIFDKKENRCYFVGEQGPCESYEVVKEQNGDEVTCVAKCDYENPNYRTMESKGLCLSGNQQVQCISLVATLEEAECPPGTLFSTKLQKCIKYEGKILD